MKKLTNRSVSLLLLLAFVAFLSCEETTTESPRDESIVGFWTMLSVNQSNCTNPDDNEFVTLVCTVQSCITFEFKTDMTFQAVSVDQGIEEIVDGTYSVSGSDYSMTADGETIMGSLNFESGNLIMNSVDPDNGCNVEATFERK